LLARTAYLNPVPGMALPSTVLIIALVGVRVPLLEPDIVADVKL